MTTWSRAAGVIGEYGAKTPYIFVKEPYIPRNKPYLSAKEPYISAKRAISAKEPYIPGNTLRVAYLTSFGLGPCVGFL